MQLLENLENCAEPAHLLPNPGHGTECVRAEKLDTLASKVTALELRDGGGPDDLR